MAATVKVKHLMDCVTQRTQEFLAQELGVHAAPCKFELSDVQRLDLRHLTALMVVEGGYNTYLAFSFDEPLILTLFERYTADIEVKEEEVEEFVEETAADIINIITGNITEHLAEGDRVVRLSPPVVFTRAKRVARYKDAQFFTVDLCSEYGVMSVFCIGPHELFDSQLNYVDEGTG